MECLILSLAGALVFLALVISFTKNYIFLLLASIIEANEYVDRVTKVQQPYKIANRQFHPNETIVNVDGRTIGGDTGWSKKYAKL